MEGLAQHPRVQSEGGGDGGGLRLGGVAAGGFELRLEPRIPAHRPLHGLGVRAGHPLLGGDPVGDDLVQAAGTEDPVPGEDLEITGARVLRQVADPAAGRDRAAGRLTDAGQHLGQGRLPGPVAADESDSVTGRDSEARVLEEQSRARAELDVGGSDHGFVSRGGRGVREATPVRVGAERHTMA